MTADLTGREATKRTANREERKVIAYWRNSLADSTRMSAAAGEAWRARPAPKAAVRAGRLDRSVTEDLFKKYADEFNRGKDSGAPYIPVLVCPVKANLRFEHGVLFQGWLAQLYPVWIPAVLH